MPNAVARVLRPVALLALAALAAVTPARAGTETLRLAIWTNYMPDDILAEFEQTAGCIVETAWNYSSNDELLARLEGKATGFDLAVPSDVILPALIAGGMLEPIDKAALGNAAHADPAFAKRQADPEGKWTVPYTWGTVGIAWRTDKVKQAPDSWHAFADPALAGGNGFLLEEARDVVSAALLANGKDVNAVDAPSLAAAKATLLSWRKAIKGFTGETKDHLLTGEAWLLMAYNGDVAQAMKEQPGKFGFAVPKEGGILWIDNFVIPKGAPQKALAHKFIDFVLDPKVAARISASIRYALANKDAAAHLPADLKADAVIYAPDDVKARLHQYKDLGADLTKVTDVLTEVRAK
jgi:spermidine/putrescine transport system substrate-binding protein